MAKWLIQSKEDEHAPKPYVDICPRMPSWESSTHQQNPPEHPQKGSIGNTGTYDPKYYHYCTRLFRWSNINPEELEKELNKEPTYIDKTKRFGDMGGYYVRTNGTYDDLGNFVDDKSVFTRYRFSMADSVPYAEYGARGTLWGNRVQPFTAAGRDGTTCGWLPNGSTSNFWRPSAADRAKIVNGIESYLSTKGTNLAALKNKTTQQWNAAVVAWFHAGYQRIKVSESTGAILIPYKGGYNRAVSACDVYFFSYLY